MNRLAGKACLVTGAGGGIGAAVAAMMVREGAAVCLSDIDGERARQAADGIDGETIALAHDVTSRSQWQAAIAACETAFGKLNVLVNNAGVCIPAAFDQVRDEDWERTLAIDLTSVRLGCQEAIALLYRSAPSSIINVSSISAMVAGYNMAAYNAAKAGVHMFTKSVALRAARKYPGVRANSLHPAFVDTDMVDAVVTGEDGKAARAKLARQVPIGRIATVEDVAYAAVYLASDESAFMTGAEIKLDGGLSAG